MRTGILIATSIITGAITAGIVFLIGLAVGRHATVEESPPYVGTIRIQSELELQLDAQETTYYNVPLSHDVQDELFKACKYYQLDPALVLGLIEAESCFDATLVSETDDYGLMQINSVCWEEINEQYGKTLNPYDPKDNIWAGCYLLAQALKAADGNIPKGLMAYNMGLYGARSAWEQGVTETDYSRTVMGYAADYREANDE